MREYAKVYSLGQHFPSAPPHCVAAGLHCAKLMATMPIMARPYITDTIHMTLLWILPGSRILTRRNRAANLGTVKERIPGAKDKSTK